MHCFVRTVRLLQVRVSQIMPAVQMICAIVAFIGAVLVTLGLIQVFGNEGGRPPSVPWTLMTGTCILAIDLLLVLFFGSLYLILCFLLACMNLVQRMRRKREQGENCSSPLVQSPAESERV